jgi:type I restriction enzyme, S subunit
MKQQCDMSSKFRERGKLPQNWRLESFSQVLELKHGHQFLEGDFVRDGLKVLKIGQILRNGTLNLKNCDFISKSRQEEFKEFLIGKGDVLMALTGATLGKTVIVKEDIGQVFQNYRVGNFLPKNEKEILKNYLYFVLSSKFVQNQIFNLVNVQAQPNIGKSDFDRINILIPPLKEQEKITFILSNVDELIQKTDQIIEQTQILKKGLMERLLIRGIGHTKFKKTEFGEIPEEWNISSIGEKCKLGTGGTPRRSKPDYFKGEIPWVKTGEINFKPINSTEEHISRKAVEESSAKVYPKGSLLVAMYGQGITRGRSAILNIDAAINQACAAIQSLGDMSVIFLFYWCQYNYEKIRSISQGTHQSNLNLEYISNIKILCPSLIEQKTIENILSRIDLLVERRILQSSKLKVIKNGLMQQLLTGKVRVKV